MKIQLKLLGIPPDVIPLSNNEMEVGEQTTVREAVLYLVEKYSRLSEEYLEGATFLVNSQRAEPEKVLQEGDVLMILRTLGGG